MANQRYDMELIYRKYGKLMLSNELKQEFYADLVQMMNYYRQLGATSEHDFPRTEGS